MVVILVVGVAVVEWVVVGGLLVSFFSEAVAGGVGLLGREERELSLVVACGGNYWLNHGVLAMAVVLVACVVL